MLIYSLVDLFLIFLVQDLASSTNFVHRHRSLAKRLSFYPSPFLLHAHGLPLGRFHWDAHTVMIFGILSSGNLFTWPAVVHFNYDRCILHSRRRSKNVCVKIQLILCFVLLFVYNTSIFIRIPRLPDIANTNYTYRLVYLIPTNKKLTCRHYFLYLTLKSRLIKQRNKF